MILRSINNRTFAKRRPNEVSNPRSYGQMVQRTKMANIMNVYGRMKPALRDNFQGKDGGQSDYTMFMSRNLSRYDVHLTKNEALNGFAVIAPYVVADGRLASVEYVLCDGWLVSNIMLGNLVITSDTTVGDLASAIIDNNMVWKDQDVLELISVTQSAATDSSGRYTAVSACCCYTNIVLDRCDESKLQRFLGNLVIKADDHGMLCMLAQGEGGFAMVRKRLLARKVAASYQQLEVTSSLLPRYASVEQCDSAVASYLAR